MCKLEQEHLSQNFPGGLVVKTSPSSARGAIVESGRELPHMPQNQDIKQKQCCNTFSKDFFLKKRTSISSSALLEDDQPYQVSNPAPGSCSGLNK